MNRLLHAFSSPPGPGWLCAVFLAGAGALPGYTQGAETTMLAVVPATGEHGTACWHQGHDRTADGGRWSPEGFTAAHRSLPLGTRVRVVNLKTGRSTVVRVTDRGPFTNKFIIDLSPAAAREVGLLEAGIGKVRVEVLAAPDAATKPAA